MLNAYKINVMVLFRYSVDYIRQNIKYILKRPYIVSVLVMMVEFTRFQYEKMPQNENISA